MESPSPDDIQIALPANASPNLLRGCCEAEGCDSCVSIICVLDN